MNTKYYILFLGLMLSLVSCEIDNYDEPQASFTGALTYQGDTIRVAQNDVRFQLWQSGFGKEGPLDVHVSQDGSFSSLLFNGDYRLKFIEGQGPFKALSQGTSQGDTIYLNLSGDTNMELEVMPYYMIRNPEMNLAGASVNASIDLQQVITGEDARDIEHVTLYLNTTRFVSANGDMHVARADADLGDMSNLNMTVDIPGEVVQDYIFARVGVKISGVEDMIYSPLQKLNF
ncbi:MAG: DUF3823 domain-containing protein [Christiangramia sp.]|uniref:DUF3823 domain-containing protein n=1 Tax=Christiangramia sp. TaxID=1931228 RepID=UPI003242546F